MSGMLHSQVDARFTDLGGFPSSILSWSACVCVALTRAMRVGGFPSVFVVHCERLHDAPDMESYGQIQAVRFMLYGLQW